MKYLLTLLLIAFSFSAYADLSPKTSTLVTALEAKLQKAQSQFKLPGCAMAIVEGDKIIYAKGFGIREVGKTDPITTDTLFQIGSVTKGFTATLIAKLMSEGKLDWNRTIKSYLPDFELADPEMTEKLTLKDVLAQRSGLPLYAGDEWVQKGENYAQALTHLKEIKPIGAIGEKFSYQNSLYCLSGQIIQQAIGTSWDEALQTNLLKPAGMLKASTTLTAIQQETNTAKPHDITKKGTKKLPWSDFGYLVSCAGGLNMNIMDLARYLTLQMNEGRLDGQQLIPANFMKELQTPQISTVGTETAYKKHFYPDERVDKTFYGLGLRMSDWAGHRVISHGGYVSGEHSSLTFIPELKLGLVVLSNAMSSVPAVLHSYFLDLALDLKPIDWITHAKIRQAKEDREEAAKAKKNAKPKKAGKQKPKKPKIAKTG